MGHALMDSATVFWSDAYLTRADGHVERIAALHMIEPRADRPHAITVGADKAYDAEDFVNELRSMKASPHVAQTWRGCPNCWRSRHERACELPTRRPLADRRGRTSGIAIISTSVGSDDHDPEHGRGEIAFGALQAGLNIEYSRSLVGGT
jgi:hypothetical protein